MQGLGGPVPMEDPIGTLGMTRVAVAVRRITVDALA